MFWLKQNSIFLRFREDGEPFRETGEYAGIREISGESGRVGKPNRKRSQGPCPAVIGGCLSLRWCAWRDRRAEPWVVEVLRKGYAIPFRMPPPLSPTPIILDSYSPQFCQGEGFGRGDSGSSPQGSGGAFASNSGLLKPHVCCDLSTLNLSVDRTSFRMEASQTVLRSVCRNDWMVSIDLKDAYLQIPIHPESCKYVPQVHSRREDLAVSGPLLRSVHSPTGVHSCDGTCVGIPPSAGNPDASVSG